MLNQPCQKIVVGVIQHTGLRLIQRRVVALAVVLPVGAYELEQSGHHSCRIAGQILKQDDTQLLAREKAQVSQGLLGIVTAIQIGPDKSLRIGIKREGVLVEARDMCGRGARLNAPPILLNTGVKR